MLFDPRPSGRLRHRHFSGGLRLLSARLFLFSMLDVSHSFTTVRSKPEMLINMSNAKGCESKY